MPRHPQRPDQQRQQAAGLRDRAARAALIVLTRSVQQQLDGSWLVQSQRDVGCFYRVDDRGCSCVDAYRAPDGWCKHRLAAAIVARARGGDTAA